jgi:hypothetical protein
MEPKMELEEEVEVEGETISVRLTDVPECLRNSELYRTFLQNNENKDETLSLPSKYFKSELSMNNGRELTAVLTIARYWMVDDLPDEVYDFVTTYVVAEVGQFSGSFPVLSTMQRLRKSLPSTWLADSARWGDLQLMKYLRRKGHPWDRECIFAADGGHLECLKYAHQAGCKLTAVDSCSCRVALERGSTECFLYACKNGCPAGSSIDSAMFERHEDASCLEYVLNRPTLADLVEDVHELGHTAIALRSPSCIDKLCQLGWDIQDDSGAFLHALETCDLATIEHVIRRGGSKYNSDVFGELFLTSRYYDLGPATVLIVVSLLLDRGNIFTIESLEKIVASDIKLEVVRTLIKRGAYPTERAATLVIARMGCVDLLTAAFEYGCQPAAEVSQLALQLGDLAMLKCGIKYGCTVPAPASAEALVEAANEGEAAKVQYLLQLLLREAATAAERSGSAACVQLLQQHLQLYDSH